MSTLITDKQSVVGGLPSGLVLEIVAEDEAWPALMVAADFYDPIAAAIGRFVELEGTERAVVALANDARVQDLNSKYRSKDQPTNVLSFPAPDLVDAAGATIRSDQASFLGDIILARETVTLEADEQFTSFEHHTAHLVIHGILHLLGYDHEDPKDAEEMEALEIDILADLGIANPYTEELDNAD